MVTESRCGPPFRHFGFELKIVNACTTGSPRWVWQIACVPASHVSLQRCNDYHKAADKYGHNTGCEVSLMTKEGIVLFREMGESNSNEIFIQTVDVRRKRAIPGNSNLSHVFEIGPGGYLAVNNRAANARVLKYWERSTSILIRVTLAQKSMCRRRAQRKSKNERNREIAQPKRLRDPLNKYEVVTELGVDTDDGQRDCGCLVR
ncbi:hypothetical protein J1614_011101 [Plenodomus biglobosus]|nr:hypothetical protein J1614_011101 [Plenodomus biglobosus]